VESDVSSRITKFVEALVIVILALGMPAPEESAMVPPNSAVAVCPSKSAPDTRSAPHTKSILEIRDMANLLGVSIYQDSVPTSLTGTSRP
jgi:hypothetical protein